MAIDDNTTYGLTGAQIKDLAERIKDGEGTEQLGDNVQLWTLAPGAYITGSNNKISLYRTAQEGELFLVGGRAGNSLRPVIRFLPSVATPSGATNSYYVGSNIYIVENGLERKNISVGQPVSELTVTADGLALGAEQGKILKDMIDAIAVPTAVSQLTNDANYQNATQVSSAIATAVGQITEFKFEVVQTLPATGDTSTIYLVPIAGSVQNTYDEYLYVSNAWERIGSTEIDLSNYVQFSDLATVATTGDYNDLTNLPEDMVVLSYGTSTWADFLSAYRDNHVVYCRASSSADPSSGNQTRMAFMAYVNNSTNPTEVEFQYVRSVSNKTAAQQMDQVFVYKLTSANGGTWTVETRNMTSSIVAGTNMTSSYSNGTLTLNATVPAQQQSDWDQSDTTAADFIKNKPTIPTVGDGVLTINRNGLQILSFHANATSNSSVNIIVPEITMTTTDPGEGSALAANNFIAVYQ